MLWLLDQTKQFDVLFCIFVAFKRSMELSGVVQNELRNLTKLDNATKVINKAFETIVNPAKGNIEVARYLLCIVDWMIVFMSSTNRTYRRK